MIEIYYDAWADPKLTNKETMQLLTPDPEHALGSAQTRGKHLTCPAVQDFHRNAFTVFSPFTVTYKFNRATRNVEITGDKNFMQAEFTETGSIELQTYPQYIFRTNKSVIAQMLPPLLQVPVHPSYVAAGEFDISQWVRPVNAAFIIPNNIDTITINKGDPLFSIRFVTKNNEPVKLVRRALSKQEEDLANACMNVTNIQLGNPLSKLYEYFKRFRTSKKSGKCPFHHK